MARIVLDTNVLISAIGWNSGLPRKIFDLCMLGRHALIESSALLDEFLEVMSRPKFDFISRKDLREFVFLLKKICEIVEPKARIDAVKEDPKDNMVIECAVEGNADYIVTGDSHLLALKGYGKIKIMSAGEFLKC